MWIFNTAEFNAPNVTHMFLQNEAVCRSTAYSLPTPGLDQLSYVRLSERNLREERTSIC